MDPEAWKWIMFCARQHAAIYNQRAKVTAVKLPERIAHRRGTGWYYIINEPRGGW